jgi:modification methylase
MTRHSLFESDCRDLSFIEDASVQLIITHPPGFRCEAESTALGQLSAIGDYEAYLAELDKVWAECERVLSPGGYLVCVVSPVACGKTDLPLGADVQLRVRRYGLEATASIRWLDANTIEPDEADFIGKPNQPCRDLVHPSQDLLVIAKHGTRIVSESVERNSRLSARDFASASAPVWLIPRDPAPPHPQSFPVALATRLVQMFSFVGDTVLDPFTGAGTTNVAALINGRSSVGVEIEPSYFDALEERLWEVPGAGGQIELTRRAEANPPI